jgi:single-stranded DNA-binding protein
LARVGTEPELKTSQAGKPRTSVNVAVGDGGEVQWLRLAVLGDLAQQLAGHLHKGDRIYAEGRLNLKPKAPPEGEQPAPPSTVPRHDWQKPASAFDEIPF